MTRRLPPLWLEACAKYALPSSRRDDILGDLQERYTSPTAYVCDSVQLVVAVHAGALFRLWQRARTRSLSVMPKPAASHSVRSLRLRAATVVASSRFFIAPDSVGRLATLRWWTLAAFHALLAAASDDTPHK